MGWDVQVEVARYSKMVIFLPLQKIKPCRTTSKKKGVFPFTKTWVPMVDIQLSSYPPSMRDEIHRNRVKVNTSAPTPNETKTSKGRPWQLLLGIFHGLCCDGRGLGGSKIGKFLRKYADELKKAEDLMAELFQCQQSCVFFFNCGDVDSWWTRMGVCDESILKPLDHFIGSSTWFSKVYVADVGMHDDGEPLHIWQLGFGDAEIPWHPFFWIAYLEIFDQIW